jgi:septal ring factor EnvC (AmiA/AmiB activator)
MTESREEIRAFTKKEKHTLDSLNEIDLSIDQARKRIVASEKELRILEDEVSTVLAESEAVKEAVQARETHAGKRMVSLYKLGSLGRMHVLASADSLTDFLGRRKALERILENDRVILEDYGRRTAELAELSAQLARQKQQRAAMEEAHRLQLREMKTQRRRRKELLAEIRDQKALREATLASLRKRAVELDRKIQSFRVESPEKEGAPGEAKGAFSRLKGLLNMPVKGKIMKFFGPYRNKEYGVMNFQSGIDIKADRGEPIHSVYGGRVIFSNWFKGYGNMVIIDHEDHYYTLYAHAEELFKQKGDRVHTDEVIGTVGDSGAIGGPSLHFEVRHRGKPVDPMTWLKKG